MSKFEKDAKLLTEYIGGKENVAAVTHWATRMRFVLNDTSKADVEKIKAIMKAGKEVNPDIMVICHGGPIAEPQDAAYIIENIEGIDGFFGASSIERFAAEKGIKEQTASFKSISKK